MNCLQFPLGSFLKINFPWSKPGGFIAASMLARHVWCGNFTVTLGIHTGSKQRVTREWILKFTWDRLGYVCNPRSLKEGTETSRRRTDELGYRLERPIHFECKLNEPMHIGMRLLHPAAADHSVSINRQQVQRIFRFSLRSRAGARPLSGGTGAVATGRDVSVPSFRERGLHT